MNRKNTIPLGPRVVFTRSQMAIAPTKVVCRNRQIKYIQIRLGNYYHASGLALLFLGFIS